MVLPHYTIEADTTGGYRLPISTRKSGAIMWDAMHFASLGYPEDRPSKLEGEANPIEAEPGTVQEPVMQP
jgi:hypothetical protein